MKKHVKKSKMVVVKDGKTHKFHSFADAVAFMLAR